MRPAAKSSAPKKKKQKIAHDRDSDDDDLMEIAAPPVSKLKKNLTTENSDLRARVARLEEQVASLKANSLARFEAVEARLSAHDSKFWA